MRDISMERVNETREKMLETVKSPTLTHEQKVATMANLADSLLEVVHLRSGRGTRTAPSPVYYPGLCEIYERGKQIPAAGSAEGSF